LTVWLLAALIVPACATTVDPVPTPSHVASPSAGAEAMPPVVEELPEFPGSLVATPGIPWEPPPRMSEGDTTHDSVTSLLLALRRILDTEESEVRVGLLGEPSDDAAQAYLQATVLGHDSVAGTEILFELRRGARGWYMTNAQVRSHCRRAVDLDTGFCV
jgi:hypothetical protein